MLTLKPDCLGLIPGFAIQEQSNLGQVLNLPLPQRVLSQWSPTFLAQGTGFPEGSFSTEGWRVT